MKKFSLLSAGVGNFEALDLLLCFFLLCRPKKRATASVERETPGEDMSSDLFLNFFFQTNHPHLYCKQ